MSNWLVAAEQRAVRLLSSVPVVHDAAALAYQAAFSLLAPRMASESVAEVRRAVHCFFGFHDKCPWDASMHRILCQRERGAPDFRRAPAIEIGVLDAESLRFEAIGRTRTWNWQQGAMVQWVGKSGIAYNDDESGSAVTRLLVGDRHVTLAGHTCSASPDGQSLLGYSFARLVRVAPEYGYWLYAARAASECAAPQDDGLFLTDIVTGDRTLLRSLADLASEVRVTGAFHYVTHATLSPSGTCLAFFHRWRRDGGRLGTRLVIGRRDGSEWHVAPIASPSHYCWDGDTGLIVTDSDWGGACYQHWTIGDPEARSLSAAAPTVDGHPQVNPADARFVLSDTYPDRRRQQSLLLLDRELGESTVLCREQIGLGFRRGRRCDYHPRWRQDGRAVCFDTAGTGTRCLAVISLE